MGHVVTPFLAYARYGTANAHACIYILRSMYIELYIFKFVQEAKTYTTHHFVTLCSLISRTEEA